MVTKHFRTHSLEEISSPQQCITVVTTTPAYAYAPADKLEKVMNNKNLNQYFCLIE